MEVYALYEKLNNNEYRWNTILRFGESWDPIGTVVMKNPGSAAPQEKVSDVLSEILNQNFCGQQYAQHTWYHFSPDITMKCIERLFRGYYGEKMSGVIRIFNLCNLISPDYKKLLNKLKNSDELDNSLVYTGTFDITQMSAPIYIGWGKAWKKDFKDNYKPYFEKAIAEDNTILDKHVEVNPFFHPLYLMNYGASKSNDIRERFVESIVLNIAKQFVNDPAGDYEYLGELEPGKHFVKYMFAEDCMDGDVALCVGGPQLLVVEGNKCRYATCEEFTM